MAGQGQRLSRPADALFATSAVQLYIESTGPCGDTTQSRGSLFEGRLRGSDFSG